MLLLLPLSLFMACLHLTIKGSNVVKRNDKTFLSHCELSEKCEVHISFSCSPTE